MEKEVSLNYGTDYVYAGGGAKGPHRCSGMVTMARNEEGRIILSVCPEDDFYWGTVDITDALNELQATGRAGGGGRVRGGGVMERYTADWWARKLAQWLFERTGFPDNPARVGELLEAYPWLRRSRTTTLGPPAQRATASAADPPPSPPPDTAR